MATTTPNYGWTVPTSTDLVKDGATAIETLGDAIDASMNTALGTKKAGRVLLNTTTMSAVSTQTINSVFSATYDTYEILISNVTSSAANNCYFQFTSSGTPDTNTVYHWLRLAIANASVSGAAVASQAQWILGKIDTTKSQITVTLSNPFAAGTKGYLGIGGGRTNGALFTGDFSNSTSFDGFKLFLDSGTVTGTVTVFGVNK
jgi:hypothetical protein